MKNYVIIGAGISGLSTAWFLKQRYGNTANITILEKENRSGGWIRTLHHEGFIFDTGPRSCRTQGAGQATLQLIEALGLQNQVIPCSPAARHRYLYTNERLKKLPSTLLGSLISPLTRPYLPLLWKERSIGLSSLEDESIASFISRRFSRECAETLFDPLTLGIYAGDINTLSFPSCFPSFAADEKTHGSLVKALWKQKQKPTYASSFIQEMSKAPIITFKEGMETLTRSLQKALHWHLKLNNQVLEISPAGSQVAITTPNERILADHVYLTIPPSAICHLIRPLEEAFSSFKSATVAAVHLGWNERNLTKEGFGYLIPSKEKEPLLGVIFDSSAFPQQNRTAEQTRLTLMLGGTTGIPVASMTDESLIEIGKNALKKHLGIYQIPEVAIVSRAPCAIPQYTIGHAQRVADLKLKINSLFDARVTLLGSSWHGVSVNDCILEASLTVEI